MRRSIHCRPGPAAAAHVRESSFCMSNQVEHSRGPYLSCINAMRRRCLGLFFLPSSNHPSATSLSFSSLRLHSSILRSSLVFDLGRSFSHFNLLAFNDHTLFSCNVWTSLTDEMKSTIIAAGLLGAVAARPDVNRYSFTKREVPQEHAHRNVNLVISDLLTLNNPDQIQDPIFGLLGAAAGIKGAGKIADAGMFYISIAKGERLANDCRLPSASHCRPGLHQRQGGW
jgi:hypothetical protein